MDWQALKKRLKQEAKEGFWAFVCVVGAFIILMIALAVFN